MSVDVTRIAMTPITPEQLLGQLRWRYATKKFDPSRKIPAETWSALEESLVLTPSSYGLQPWKFFVITDPEVSATLKEHSWGQAQITDASHLVVITAKTNVSADYVDHFMDAIESIQGRSKEALKGYRDVIVGDVVEGPRSKDVVNWAKRQCYIALGNLLDSAALLGIDACPMEGFQPDKYDEVLKLPEKGLTAAVLCTLGYRSDEDKYAEAPKVRFPAEEVIERI